MVDLHAHLPQLPNAGLGAGLDLLTWLERYIFPLERGFDAAAAERLAPAAWRAFAAAGTTTALVYGAVYEASLDATFRAAEAHGIRAIVGKVMMDRGTYDPTIDPKVILDQSLRRIRGAHRSMARRRRRPTPVRGHAAVRHLVHGRPPARVRRARRQHRCVLADARVGGSRRDRRGRPAVPRRHSTTSTSTTAPAGSGSGPYSPMPSISPTGSLVGSIETGTRVAHCPVSNLFLASGMMPLGRYLDAGMSLGLGSDVAGGPGPLDLHGRCGPASTCRTPVAWPASKRDASSRRWTGCASGRSAARRRSVSATITGSLETGKEADVIAVDPAFTAPVPGVEDDEPADIASRMIFRSHPDMVRAAWVRGRRLEGPGARSEARA